MLGFLLLFHFWVVCMSMWFLLSPLKCLYFNIFVWLYTFFLYIQTLASRKRSLQIHIDFCNEKGLRSTYPFMVFLSWTIYLKYVPFMVSIDHTYVIHYKLLFYFFLRLCTFHDVFLVAYAICMCYFMIRFEFKSL